MEKAERASVPTRATLRRFNIAYNLIKENLFCEANAILLMAKWDAFDEREADEIQSVGELLDKPQEAMARIADILTSGGRIYDEFSEFLRGEKSDELR